MADRQTLRATYFSERLPMDSVIQNFIAGIKYVFPRKLVGVLSDASDNIDLGIVSLLMCRRFES